MRPPSGWLSIALVALMLLIVAWSIQAAEYAQGLDILTPIVLGGVLAGVILGGVRWLPATLAHGWSLVFGILAAGYLGTYTLRHYMPAEEVAVLATSDRMAVVRDWYIEWLVAASGRGVVREELVPFAFVTTMALLLWLLSYISAWFVVRYVSWWGAVLPAGFALLFNLYQAPNERLKAMAFFLLCAFLLAQQTHTTLQIDRWRREHISFSPGIGFDFMRDAVVVALVVIGLGWMAPDSINSERLSGVMQGFTGASHEVEARFQQLFPTLNYPVRGGGNAFASTMPLGGSISLGQQAIFDAAVDGAVLQPRYWRMTVFDRYDGRSWERTFDDASPGDAFEHDLAADYALTVPVTQTIRTLQSNTEQLYAMPQPERFSVPVVAEMAGSDAEPDVVTVSSQSRLQPDDRYTVVSRQTVADVTALGAAGRNDPDWVTERYLQVPDSVTDRVRETAALITADATNRFDQASLIEAYLRGFEYSEEIDTPPSNRDRVDWFLFDEQRGYCDYFSSAFVVMARSVGVPARMAAGYSVGEFLPEVGAFRQHEYDAHTWPEVYFPEYGWVEFEPTAGDAALDRPLNALGAEEALADGPEGVPDHMEEILPDDALDQPIEMPDAAAASVDGGPSIPVAWLWALAVSLLLAATAFGAAYVAWQRPLRGLTVAEGTFARMARVAAWLGLPARNSDTPHEYGERLAEAIPEGRAEITTIVDAFVRERFGRQRPGTGGERLANAWLQLRASLPRVAGRLGLDRLRRR